MPDLDYFAGTWEAEARDPSSGARFELVYRVEPFLGGAWYRGRGVAAALGLEIHDVWGTDPVTGEIVRSVFDSAGTFGLVRARGWDGDVLVFEGEARAKTGVVQVRETITRRTADHFEAVWEALRDGAWAPYSVESLRRQAG